MKKINFFIYLSNFYDLKNMLIKFWVFWKFKKIWPCRNKNDLSAGGSQDEDSDSVEYEHEKNWEEQRKFGFANTFKIPDGADAANLS